MGNESSDSNSSTHSDEESDTDNIEESMALNGYHPSFSTGVFGIYCMKKHNEDINSDKLDGFTSFNRFMVKVYLQHLERILSIDICPIIYDLSCSYLDAMDIGDHFDENNKGPRCKLNDEKTECMLTHNGSNTVYGKLLIGKHPFITAYKWKFKIISIKLNIFIGIDSNPCFPRSDFSNFFRCFNTSHDEIFCSYGSDGNVYHHVSRDAYKYGTEWDTGDELEMIVDMKHETLSYCVNGKYQGTAMSELQINNQKTFKMAVALFYEEDAITLIDFSVQKDFVG